MNGYLDNYFLSHLSDILTNNYHILDYDVHYELNPQDKPAFVCDLFIP